MRLFTRLRAMFMQAAADLLTPCVQSGESRDARLLYILLRQLRNMEIRQMSALDSLKAQVEQNQTITASAVALLQGLKAKLDEAIASGDPAQVQALSDALGQDNADLAAAISANTPADPPAAQGA